MKHTEIDMKKAEAIAPKVGVFEGISNAEYHSGPEKSKSSTDLIRKSPAHYLHSRTAERKETAAFLKGTMTHDRVLEPEEFWNRYAEPFVAPEGALDTMPEMKAYLKALDLPVGGNKPDLADRIRAADPSAIILDDARAEHAASVGDKQIITAADMAEVVAMHGQIMSHPKAGKLLAPGSGVPELSCYWTDEETGVRCRCRPDFWRHDGVIVDLKTCLDASYDGFQKSVWKWRYHVQAAFYLDGIEAALRQAPSTTTMPAPKAFLFVAVEKTAPYGVGVYHLDAQNIAIGRREYREDLARFAECERTGEWPAYSPNIEAMSLPDWVLRREEYEHADEGEVA